MEMGPVEVTEALGLSVECGEIFHKMIKKHVLSLKRITGIQEENAIMQRCSSIRKYATETISQISPDPKTCKINIRTIGPKTRVSRAMVGTSQPDGSAASPNAERSSSCPVWPTW